MTTTGAPSSTAAPVAVAPVPSTTGASLPSLFADVYRSHCLTFSIHPNSIILRRLEEDLSTSSMTTEIDLSNNFVGPNGVIPLLHTCRDMTSLKVLSLRDNQLTNDTVVALCSILARHPSLASLDLSKNPISHAGGKALLRFVSRESVVTRCELTDTYINVALTRRIVEQAEQRRLQQATSAASPATVVDRSIKVVAAAPEAAAARRRYKVGEGLAAISRAMDELMAEDVALVPVFGASLGVVVRVAPQCGVKCV